MALDAIELLRRKGFRAHRLDWALPNGARMAGAWRRALAAT
jgi:hypothetical protein